MCIHYESAANKAENTKAILKTEEENLIGEKNKLETELEEITKEKEFCVECSGEIVSLMRILNDYASTFKQLGSELEKIKVNGDSYDKGKCYEISNQITSVREEFGTIQDTIIQEISVINDRIPEINTRVGEIDTRLSQIKGEISELNVTINRKYWTCNSCRVLLETTEPHVNFIV